MQEKPYFKNPVQTAPALQDATKINRRVYTQAAVSGLLGEAAYKSGDTWLFNINHPDFDKWFHAHWNQRRVKGERDKKQAQQNTSHSC